MIDKNSRGHSNPYTKNSGCRVRVGKPKSKICLTLKLCLNFVVEVANRGGDSTWKKTPSDIGKTWSSF